VSCLIGRLVTQKGFEGCINEVQLGQAPKDINENLEIKDIQQGCSEVITFEVTAAYGRNKVHITLGQT
jgi:hypothetical protein